MGERIPNGLNWPAGRLAMPRAAQIWSGPGYGSEGEMAGYNTRVVDATDIEFGELRRMLATLARMGWQVREVPGISTGSDGRLRLVLVRQNQA